MCTIQSKLSILVKVTLSAIATTIMMTMMRIMWRPTRHVTTRHLLWNKVTGGGAME